MLQEIVRHGASSENGQYNSGDVLLSIVYRFNIVSATTPPLSPDSTTFSTSASRPGTAGSHFSSESSVSHLCSHPDPTSVVDVLPSLA